MRVPKAVSWVYSRTGKGSYSSGAKSELGRGGRVAEWQEGSVLSSLDAITRLHQRAMSA
jgi:hypothetical protein